MFSALARGSQKILGLHLSKVCRSLGKTGFVIHFFTLQSPHLSLYLKLRIVIMDLQVAEVTSDSDFDEIVPLLWLAYSNPRIPYLPLLFPAENDSPEAREKQVKLSKDGLMHAHHSNPSSHWIKVTDKSSGKIVAACRWHIHEKDPYSGKPPLVLNLTAWPEGDRKKFAEMSLGSIILPRRQRYTRPHVGTFSTASMEKGMLIDS